MPYTVIRDTRERQGHGWNFRKSQYCAGQVVTKVDTGDYTLLGMEEHLSIDRKGRVTEFVKNLTEDRFRDVLQRMELITFPFVIFEFTIEDLLKYPVGSGIPKYKWKYLKVRGPAALKMAMDLHMDYKTKFLFCGTEGQTVARSIFKRVMERYCDSKKPTSSAQPTAEEIFLSQGA